MPRIRLARACGPPLQSAIKGLSAAAALAALLTLAAASAEAAPGPAPGHGISLAGKRYRNVLISDQMIGRLSAADVRAELGNARIGPGEPALGGRFARYGLVAYRVIYGTTDAAGRPVIASGVVAFPQSGTRQLQVVEYEHGTTADKADVPSSFGLDAAGDGIEGRWSAELFASAGFAVAEPDYVGLGSSPGRPEYMAAASEVSASLDLLHAAAQLARERGEDLDRNVLVTGFSQGGAAAMAVGRALQDHPSPAFRLAALAPVSGPYDLAGAEVPGMFTGQVDPAMAAYLVGYTLTAWNPLYHLYAHPADAFAPRYAPSVEGLFDGSHSDQDIARSLPGNLQDLLTPRFLRWLRQPSGALLRALNVNSPCRGWAPQAPVRLYAAAGDRTVPQANAQHCQRALGQGRSQIPLVQLGAVDHDVSDFVALPKILRWFRHWLRP